MSLNPFNLRAPQDSGIGLLSGSALIRLLPGAYVPCRGETVLTDGDAALPIEPPYSTPDKTYSIPAMLTMGIDRDPPFYDQTGMSVATPCVSPYQWEGTSGEATPANLRTVILDSVPDVAATGAEKALPGYVANPGLFLSSRTMDLVAPSSPAYDDEDGVAFLWTFPLDRNDIPVTSTVNGSRYKVTEKGDGTRTVGEEYTAAGTGAGSERVTEVKLPHPALRSGGTRYSYPEITLVGTGFSGTAFLPGEVGKFTSGTLQVCAYRYGLMLGTASWPVTVKIGRGTASWDQAAKELTLACATEDSSIYYSTDGSAPTDEYSTPLSITSTKTVRWYARKLNGDTPPVAMMQDSDEWQTAITYDGTFAPPDFETVVFSALPATTSNATVQAAVPLPRQPAFYVSVNGSGSGEAPEDPGGAAYIIGTYAVGANGMARGPRTITASLSSAPNTLQLASGGSAPVVGGAVGTSTGMYAAEAGAETAVTSLTEGDICIISTPGDTDWAAVGASGSSVGVEFVASGPGTGTGKVLVYTWSTYSSPVALGPGVVWLRLERSDNTPYTRDFRLPWFLGDLTLRAVWDKDAGTLTLSIDGLRSVNGRYLKIYYGTGGSADTLYSSPIAVGATTTYRVAVRHDAEPVPDDFDTESDEWELDPIDPDVTADFDETQVVTLEGTVASATFTQAADLVWMAEGTYTPPAGKLFYSLEPIVVRGGYSADFLSRDVKNTKTVVVASANAAGGLSLTNGVLDGLWVDFDSNDNGLYAALYYNCHCVASVSRSVDAAPKVFWGPETSRVYFCTCDVTVTSTAASDAFGRIRSTSAVTISHDTARCYGCEFAVDVESDDAGDGTYAYSAGASTASVYVGYLYDCTLTASVVAGGGGSTTRNYVPGGGSTASLTIYAMYDDSTVTADVQSSGGGNGGLNANGGGSSATVSTGNVDRSSLTATATSGGGGQSGHTPPVTANSSGVVNLYTWLGAEVSDWWVRWPVLDVSVSGGTQNRVQWGAYPTVFNADDIAITESPADGPGHPLRVNGLNGAAGWYSGTPNGNGAPISGYETPQGTGVALGRYWE